MLSMFGLAAFQVMKTFKPYTPPPRKTTQDMLDDFHRPATVRKTRGKYSGLTSAERGRKFREERAALGLCIRCDGKRRAGKATCEACAKDQKNRDKKRRAEGKDTHSKMKRELAEAGCCTNCTAKLPEGHKTRLCEECRLAIRAQDRARYASKKGNKNGRDLRADGGEPPQGSDSRAASGCGRNGGGV